MYEEIERVCFGEIGYKVGDGFFGEDVGGERLKEIVYERLKFDVGGVKVKENIYCLEVFEGGRLGFKDVGGGFMGGVLG